MTDEVALARQSRARLAPCPFLYREILDKWRNFEQKTQKSIVLQKRLDEAEEEKNILRMENGKLMDELKALKERLSELEDNESRK